MKNVTAAYSRTLDDFIRSHPDYRRSSSGRSEPAFLPDPAKTFNRGFTRYFISGRKEKIASMDTPKSIGKAVGDHHQPGEGILPDGLRGPSERRWALLLHKGKKS